MITTQPEVMSELAHTSRRSRRAVLVLLGVISTIAWVVFGTVVFAARQLRPIADDYCSAFFVSSRGLIGSIVDRYLVWQGDLVLLTLNHSLVGAPLAWLPFDVASVIPFVSTVLGVVALSLALLWTYRNHLGKAATTVAVLIVTPILAILWWGYWWVPVAEDPTHQLYAQQASNQSYNWQIASGVLEWQTVSVAYALGPVLLVVLWLVADAKKNPRARLVLFGVSGLLSGFGGLVFGLSALATIPVIAVLRMLIGRRFDRRLTTETAAFTLAGLAGWALSYFSPGAQMRGELLEATRPLKDPTFLSIFGWVFPTSVFTWAHALLTLGTLVTVIVAAGIGLASRRFGILVDIRRVLLTALALLGFALVTSVVARAGDAFSYGAFYHDVLPKTLIFVAAVLVGVAAGSRVADFHRPAITVVASVCASLALLVAMSSLIPMAQNVTERYVTWQTGAAPSSGQDLNTDWVQTCWTQWGDYRDLPARG